MKQHPLGFAAIAARLRLAWVYHPSRPATLKCAESVSVSNDQGTVFYFKGKENPYPGAPRIESSIF
jgi:hypothetical protein